MQPERADVSDPIENAIVSEHSRQEAAWNDAMPAQPGQEQRMDDLVPRVIAGSLTYRNGDPMQDGNTAVIKSEDLRALCDRLILYREALEPFALAADDLDDKHGDHSELWEAPAAMSITAGDLRHARDVLKR